MQEDLAAGQLGNAETAPAAAYGSMCDAADRSSKALDMHASS